MSSPTQAPGRVILGLHGDFSPSARPDTPLWNDETEARYMDQVRERAQLMAKDILASALAEADQIRQAARQEGLKDAQTEISAGIAQEKARIGALLSGLEASLAAEKERLYKTHEHTLFAILRLAFEKTLGIVLDAHREQILGGLLEEAVTHLHATSTVTVLVAPQDAELAREQLAALKAASSQLPELVLKVSPELAPGGVRLECGEGVVDNAIATRLDQVRAALDAGTDQA